MYTAWCVYVFIDCVDRLRCRLFVFCCWFWVGVCLAVDFLGHACLFGFVYLCVRFIIYSVCWFTVDVFGVLGFCNSVVDFFAFVWYLLFAIEFGYLV